jgi:hypothetical protein
MWRFAATKVTSDVAFWACPAAVLTLYYCRVVFHVRVRRDQAIMKTSSQSSRQQVSPCAMAASPLQRILASALSGGAVGESK